MSYRLGKKVPAEVARKALQDSPLASDQLDRMIAHLAPNDIDTSTPTLALGDVSRWPALFEVRPIPSEDERDGGGGSCRPGTSQMTLTPSRRAV
jgi:hypothetical protein